MSTPLVPLRFERHFLEKVWGGRTLERVLGFELPGAGPVGETWEIVDRERENSIVAEGPFQGRTLHELMTERGAEVLGSAPAGKDGRFPLIVKYIDASQNLSVQVHPDEASAERLGGGAEAKTEAWYVVDVAEDARLFCGLRPGVDADALSRGVTDGEVVATLAEWEVQAGDCVTVSGGTVHAIGAGVTILEVQQNSDTTYRLYDWGRVGLDGRPRETHVQEALASVDFARDAVAPAQPHWIDEAAGYRRARLAETHVFTMDALALEYPVEFDTDGAYRIYAVTEGAGTLGVKGSDEEWGLVAGDVWLVPAVCGYHRLAPAGGALKLVQAIPGLRGTR